MINKIKDKIEGISQAIHESRGDDFNVEEFEDWTDRTGIEGYKFECEQNEQDEQESELNSAFTGIDSRLDHMISPSVRDLLYEQPTHIVDTNTRIREERRVVMLPNGDRAVKTFYIIPEGYEFESYQEALNCTEGRDYVTAEDEAEKAFEEARARIEQFLINTRSWGNRDIDRRISALLTDFCRDGLIEKAEVIMDHADFEWKIRMMKNNYGYEFRLEDSLLREYR